MTDATESTTRPRDFGWVIAIWLAVLGLVFAAEVDWTPCHRPWDSDARDRVTGGLSLVPVFDGRGERLGTAPVAVQLVRDRGDDPWCRPYLGREALAGVEDEDWRRIECRARSKRWFAALFPVALTVGPNSVGRVWFVGQEEPGAALHLGYFRYRGRRIYGPYLRDSLDWRPILGRPGERAVARSAQVYRSGNDWTLAVVMLDGLELGVAQVELQLLPQMDLRQDTARWQPLSGVDRAAFAPVALGEGGATWLPLVLESGGRTGLCGPRWRWQEDEHAELQTPGGLRLRPEMPSAGDPAGLGLLLERPGSATLARLDFSPAEQVQLLLLPTTTDTQPRRLWFVDDRGLVLLDRLGWFSGPLEPVVEPAVEPAHGEPHANG
jgi:hypothetical protein